ncbi:MAG: cytochrome c3 family protein [Myxococcota bacterium]
MKPHGELGMACTECHNERGVEVADLGYAPPSPHEATPGLSSLSNCRQCHVERRTEEEFRSSRFEGAQQDLRPGKTAFVGAPPVMPHSAFMRENCLACHSGPAARAGIRTSHPERTRCRQCHLEQVVDTLFRSGSKHSEGPGG